MKQQGFTALTALNPLSKVRDFSQGGEKSEEQTGSFTVFTRQTKTHTPAAMHHMGHFKLCGSNI